MIVTCPLSPGLWPFFLSCCPLVVLRAVWDHQVTLRTVSYWSLSSSQMPHSPLLSEVLRELRLESSVHQLGGREQGWQLHILQFWVKSNPFCFGVWFPWLGITGGNSAPRVNSLSPAGELAGLFLLHDCPCRLAFGGLTLPRDRHARVRRKIGTECTGGGVRIEFKRATVFSL